MEETKSKTQYLFDIVLDHFFVLKIFKRFQTRLDDDSSLERRILGY